MSDLDKYIGKNTISLAEVMQKLENSSKGILFLTDVNGIISGCITDGDIRRYLLAGGKLEGSAVDAANAHPKTARSIEEAKSLYHRRYCFAIPIIDEAGHIIEVFDGDVTDPLPRPSLGVPVVINAGGKGTRLDPFTRVLPKPLIPVGEMPIVEHIMKEYQSYGCTEFHIIVNYKRDLMKAYFADSDEGYDITWYDEDKPLGTGGGLSLLKGKFDDTFFFANCDALLTANYDSMLRFHKENKNTITMVGAYKNLNIPYGVVDIGVNGVIEKMREKPLVSFLANTGIYIVEPEVVDDMEDNVSVGFPDIIEAQRRKGRRVAVFPVAESDWMDMGQLPELEKMRVKLYGE